MIENFIRTKSRRKILERLKRKVYVFTGTKNIFDLKEINSNKNSCMITAHTSVTCCKETMQFLKLFN